MKQEAKKYLGSQLWVEPTDSPERVDQLVKEAADCGLGWLRIFLMWPWIEAELGQWDFAVFDQVFDACEKYGIQVKATLTANSGPWHIGTASLLHSHTGFLDESQWPAVERYVEKCVTRYKDHPALGQWILWNEPSGGWEQTPQARRQYQSWLKEAYQGDIASLNRRWRTGYRDFSEAQFPEEIHHPAHAGNSWRSYRPYMDYAKFRMVWLAWELEQIQALVRRWDPETPTCVNPTPLLDNQAQTGIDQEALAQLVDYVGASYHPAWHFTFCDRELFPALMSAGVRKTASHKSTRHVEVTEVQSGNTLNSSNRPCCVEDSELARFYLAGIFAGAESVTGWLLNQRSYDFEAGDWGLLDNNDRPSSRSRMTKRVHDVMALVDETVGDHRPAESNVFVAFDQDSQLVEAQDGDRGGAVKGRQANDGALGGAVLTTLLLQSGVNASLRRLEDIPADGKGKYLFLSHLVAWSEENARKILRFADSGGTVVLDATCGRKTPDAAMYRPWPGVLSGEIGLISDGLETDFRGYELSLMGGDGGKWILTRMLPRFAPDAGWRCWDELRFRKDSAPCVWERDYHGGKIVLVNGMLGPSAVYEPDKNSAVKYVLRKVTAAAVLPVRPAPFLDAAYAIPNICEKGSLTAILANSRSWRQGKPLSITAEPGEYMDLWSGETVSVPSCGEISLPAEDGIVLLWRRQFPQTPLKSEPI